VTCEHRGRRVTRTEYAGTVTVLAGTYDGKRLHSPNDIVVKSDGTAVAGTFPSGVAASPAGWEVLGCLWSTRGPSSHAVRVGRAVAGRK
jgi:sugar lactone lactonase YvrE